MPTLPATCYELRWMHGMEYYNEIKTDVYYTDIVNEIYLTLDFNFKWTLLNVM